jgi:hypothetical protein
MLFPEHGMEVRCMSNHVADREELLVLLSEAARKGRVGAMRILLTEIGRNAEPDKPMSLGVIDEIAEKRQQR